MAAIPSPIAFISYSRTLAENRDWVRSLAERLTVDGVRVILDQWHLKPGDDGMVFMEQDVARSDYVLLICTEDYIEKANSRAGGVGHESRVMATLLTRAQIESKGPSRLIPVVRQRSMPRVLPWFMEGRLYVDLSDDVVDREAAYEDLVRTLHQTPRYDPPPIGQNPYAKGPAARPEGRPSQELPANPNRSRFWRPAIVAFVMLATVGLAGGTLIWEQSGIPTQVPIAAAPEQTPASAIPQRVVATEPASPAPAAAPVPSQRKITRSEKKPATAPRSKPPGSQFEELDRDYVQPSIEHVSTAARVSPVDPLPSLEDASVDAQAPAEYLDRRMLAQAANTVRRAGEVGAPKIDVSLEGAAGSDIPSVGPFTYSATMKISVEGRNDVSCLRVLTVGGYKNFDSDIADPKKISDLASQAEAGVRKFIQTQGKSCQ